MNPYSNFTELISATPYSKKREALEPFTTDYIMKLVAIGIRPTVEQMLSRIFSSIEILMTGNVSWMKIGEKYSFQIVTNEKVTRIDFMSDGELLASIIRETDVVWETFGHLPKKVTLMRYQWPDWRVQKGTLEDAYVVMLKKIGALEKCYRDIIA
jgi:hypothetical protein